MWNVCVLRSIAGFMHTECFIRTSSKCRKTYWVFQFFFVAAHHFLCVFFLVFFVLFFLTYIIYSFIHPSIHPYTHPSIHYTIRRQISWALSSGFSIWLFVFGRGGGCKVWRVKAQDEVVHCAYEIQPKKSRVYVRRTLFIERSREWNEMPFAWNEFYLTVMCGIHFFEIEWNCMHGNIYTKILAIAHTNTERIQCKHVAMGIVTATISIYKYKHTAKNSAAAENGGKVAAEQHRGIHFISYFFCVYANFTAERQRHVLLQHFYVDL